jgi:hypothetical protein
MGSESSCTLRVGGKRISGKALLETDHIIFRGVEGKISIPRADVQRVEAEAGDLSVTYPGGTAVFELGPLAERWAEKIRNPRGLLDKLGVKEGCRVAVLGVRDESFLEQLAARTSDIARRRPKKDSDIIFFGADHLDDLAQLARLRPFLKPNGAVWVVHRKGREATIRDVQVFAAAKEAGLVDTKVASFSGTHTAEKLVIPLALR